MAARRNGCIWMLGAAKEELEQGAGAVATKVVILGHSTPNCTVLHPWQQHSTIQQRPAHEEVQQPHPSSSIHTVQQNTHGDHLESSRFSLVWQ
ncbi:hypothetical protein LR48_Vigan2327s000100 [Vigna angularis]|nr:hypothetical protein LR48_Vigan2327s000100 [Vigna angularis]